MYIILLIIPNFLTGVPRETEKEKDLADFDIFDDSETPFSTFNFQYSNEAFTRLHDLMEFNTLNNLEVSSALVTLLQDVYTYTYREKSLGPRQLAFWKLNIRELALPDTMNFKQNIRYRNKKKWLNGLKQTSHIVGV